VCFHLNVFMVHSLKLAVIANGEHQTSVGFALGETICFRTLEFITDRFDSLSLSPKRNDSANVFMYRENLDWNDQDPLSSPLECSWPPGLHTVASVQSTAPMAEDPGPDWRWRNVSELCHSLTVLRMHSLQGTCILLARCLYILIPAIVCIPPQAHRRMLFTTICVIVLWYVV
jgi:hypothetical protein